MTSEDEDDGQLRHFVIKREFAEGAIMMSMVKFPADALPTSGQPAPMMYRFVFRSLNCKARGIKPVMKSPEKVCTLPHQSHCLAETALAMCHDSSDRPSHSTLRVKTLVNNAKRGAPWIMRSVRLLEMDEEAVHCIESLSLIAAAQRDSLNFTAGEVHHRERQSAISRNLRGGAASYQSITSWPLFLDVACRLSCQPVSQAS